MPLLFVFIGVGVLAYLLPLWLGKGGRNDRNNKLNNEMRKAKERNDRTIE